MMFERVACAISRAAGRPWAAIGAFLAIVAGLAAWAALGFSEGFLDGLNFSISVVTGLMLFVLQSSSNRDGAAIQAIFYKLIEAV